MYYLKQVFLFQIGNYFRKYLFITFVSLAFIANILCFLVMRMKHNKKHSTCVYLSITAVSDNIIMFLVFHHWFASYVESTHFTNWVCKIKLYFVYVSMTYGSYEIVFMTLDKFIAILMPHKAAYLCTSKRAYIVSAITLVVSLVYFLPNIVWTAQIGQFSQCQRYAATGWYVTAYKYMSIAVFPFVPIFAILVMNFVIIRAVWKSRNLRGNQGEQSTERQVTVMLILVSVMFVVLALPIEITDIYHSYINVRRNVQTFVKYSFIRNMTVQLAQINNGINFFLYIISGSKFRGDLKLLFCGKKSQRFTKKAASARSGVNRTSRSSPGCDNEASAENPETQTERF